jgi:hypothetical protein
LLVTCAILAALAYVAWGAYAHVDRRAEDTLARAELLRLAEALRRFHDDTGYWPGEGPFRLAGADCAIADGGRGGGVSREAIYALAPNQEAWFASPANLFLLFERPPLCGAHPLNRLAAWDAESRRGWNGPYLPLASRMWMSARQKLAGESGASAIVDLPAFGAGPKFPPETSADCVADADGCLTFADLGWRVLPASATGYDPARHELAQHARPFFFLLATGTPGQQAPRAIYWGADGRYGGTSSDDPCKPNANEEDGKDDQVICIAETREAASIPAP